MANFPTTPVRLAAATAFLAVTLPLTASADRVIDALDAARAAYEAGQISAALDHVEQASDALTQQRVDALSQLFPQPSDGWTRTITMDSARIMANTGTSGSVAEFTNGTESFSMTIITDGPMMAGMAGLFSNPDAMAAMGDVEQIDDQAFLRRDGRLTTVFDNRIMVQTSGGAIDKVVEHLRRLNFAALRAFGK